MSTITLPPHQSELFGDEGELWDSAQEVSVDSVSECEDEEVAVGAYVLSTTLLQCVTIDSATTSMDARTAYEYFNNSTTSPVERMHTALDNLSNDGVLDSTSDDVRTPKVW